ncbi:MAG: ergothioneine biosynthesis protein EgtB [Chloroflexi bacterium AL-W]|nr:ergothioneine biosynthesis protein EgtB [Chloroflexi bacterium AL-N1]NOK68722.1 ergothioneine biosynthesis protein EgtB [Chloroflexi bacterium AL-N10]NOK76208.1 ergothioneine biosynthesis protein EgtB [Chloroflexi bacterium AL-N5]NOK84155.1 ergothioneine biosynthesis protein EgtB [Chloroflexi bacterium AL-W]NOK91346.1 ergothioneine biosynthesis protein EgtB [Chloroflexi bacterium AL-N15]
MSMNVAMSRTVEPSLVSKMSDSEFASLVERYQSIRRFTEQICEPLVTEDYIIQSMPDVSPTKWHIAHTSWFFETFILSEAYPKYRSPNPQYGYLFNSYYVAAGQRHCRPKRGLLSRPTVQDVYNYRAHVDQHMLELLERLDGAQLQRWAPVVEIGLHHEQQHQELMLTDIKHNLSINPLRPAYRETEDDVFRMATPELRWISFPEGLHSIGHDGNGFSYDNESPQHRVFVEPFQLGSRLVTNSEYLAFIADGGYQRPELWLLMGWNTVQQEGWDSPLYWERYDDGWWTMTLTGMQPVNEAAPVCHINYYEADAFARWSGARLPTEAEWEIAASQVPIQGNFVETGQLHPVPLVAAETDDVPSQMFGDVWEWTQSHYSPYPGYQPVPGAIGEYNGKFMANQFVLRGGSCATSVSHIRLTYRNFFHADASWQFTGIRLAKTVKA